MKFNFVENKSSYYSNESIKKIRLISRILTVLSIVLIFILPFIWKDEYSEVENIEFSMLFRMPFIYFIICVALLSVAGVLKYVAIGKSFIDEMKNDDNDFLKQ